MLCHTVPFALLHLGQPLPAGVPELPQTFVGDDWRPSSSGSIDSDTHPLRCHWSRGADESRCPDVLTYAEEAWDAQVDGSGFYAPLPDDDGIVDIYLTNEGTGGGAYTYGPWEDSVTGDGRMGTPAYIAIDYAISDAEMAGYVVHEFNHALQYATDFIEPTYLIWESVAEAAVHWTYPSEDIYTDYIRDFQADPWMGLLGDGYQMWDDYGIWSYYEYGGSIWIFHLEDGWGDGTGISGAALWEEAAQEGWNNEPDVLDAYQAVTGGWKEAWLDLSAGRARMGTDNAPDWAPWTGGGFIVDYDGEVDAGDLPSSVTPEIGPYQTGVSYVKVSNVPDGKAVAWTIDASDSLLWSSVAAQGARDATYTDGEASFDADGSSSPVVVGIVNLGAVDFDADDRIGAASLTINLELIEATGGGDGGAEDGGADDGGADDGGATGDGGAAGDGGSESDGGAAGDGGAPDGGAPDGGADDGDDKGGCSSMPTDGGALPGAAWLLGLGLVGLRRRRRA